MTENRHDEALGLEAFEFPPDPADDFEWVPATPEVAGELAEPPEADWRTAGTTRRAFLRGVVCSGVAVSASAYMFTVQSGEARAAVRGVERLISLNVNGKTRRVDVPPNETLAQTIRYRLGLTGTKIGCNRARVRRLHGARRRHADLFLLDADPSGAGGENHNRRRRRRAGRHAPSGAAGLHR